MKFSSHQRSHGGARNAARPSAAPRQVRLIGGQWKRSVLPVLDHEGLRPTPDRVRETVFNWLNHLLDGNWQDCRCLDLFAGTGALGMEAASRGAAHVVMVENSPAVVRQLQDNAVKLNAHQVAIFRADALRYLEQYKHSGEESQFNLIFMDPPYNQDWLPKLLPQCRQALKPKGLLYVEAEFALGSEAPNDEPSGSLPDWLSNWRVVRAGKAGMVFHHLLEAVD